MEEMIRLNAGPTDPIHAQQPPQVHEMMPMVSFQQPGERGGDEAARGIRVGMQKYGPMTISKMKTERLGSEWIILKCNWIIILDNNFVYNNSFLNSCFPIVTNKC